jgi:hypothetical protein
MGGENPLAVLVLLLPWILIFEIGTYAIVRTVRLFREGRRDNVSGPASGSKSAEPD